MSNATFTFGRFNPPTEEGHGKLVSAVQSHADKTGGEHYIFPSHTQDNKKNPLSHGDKVGAMKKLFPSANIVSHKEVKTAIDSMKHLESKGHKHVTMVVGSDRVDEFHGLLNKYREKEYPGIKKISVVSAGNRDPDAEGAEGMSASKLRGLVSAGKKEEFVSHYSDPKIGKEIHDKVKAGMETKKKKLKESIGIFLLGGPGSGKDYVLKNIFSRFDLMEVQIDQVLTGAANNLFEEGSNLVINGGDAEKIQLVKMMYEDYTFDHVFVSVTNKVSRERNSGLKQPLAESKRIDKFLRAEKMVGSLEDVFVFNNSINLNESSEMEKIIFASQIEKLLERVVGLGLEMRDVSEAKTFQSKDGLKNACWKGYEAIGTKKKNGKTVPNCVPVKEENDAPLPVVLPKEKHASVKRGYKEVVQQQKANLQIAKQSGLIPEEIDINALFEMQLVGTDEYRQHAIAMTPGQTQEIEDATANFTDNKNEDQSSEDCGCGNTKTCGCEGGEEQSGKHYGKTNEDSIRRFREFRTTIQEKKRIGEDGIVDVNPVLKTKKADKNSKPSEYYSALQGLPMSARYNALSEGSDEVKSTLNNFVQHCCDHLDLKETPNINYHDDPEWSKNNGTFGHYSPSKNEIHIAITGRHLMDVMRTLAHELTHATQHAQSPLPEDAGQTGSPYENEANAMAGILMRNWAKKNPDSFRAMMESASLNEAVEYHLENNISFTENVFRPGSDNFFAMIAEAKRLYDEGKYKPADEYEQDLLESNIGDKAFYEGKEVILDFPFQENLNEDDGTGGHGIGKPFRSHGGGAVYVKNSKGNVIKVNFSQSGMKKRINEPKRVRSFVARHHCLTNKDRTSASYWACRWPRYFSDTGQQWW